MTAPKKTDLTGKRAWIHIGIPPFPQFSTITILALGFLIGNLLLLPVIALLGKMVPEVYQSSVETVAGLFKDGMLLILGYYFRDKQGNGQSADQ